jgi:hypothetical protein
MNPYGTHPRIFRQRHNQPPEQARTVRRQETATLASKADLAGQTKELKAYTTDGFTAHQELMEGHLKAIRADLDVRRNVQRLERDMEKLKKALAGQGFKISWQK